MSEDVRLFIALYTDEDVTDKLTIAIRERGFEAQCAAEAGLLNVDDAVQLSYAARPPVASTSGVSASVIVSSNVNRIMR